MQSLLQAAVIGILAVIFINLFHLKNREMGIVLSLAACVLIAVILLHLADPVITFLKNLRNMAGLDKKLMEPMLKTVGIGLLTQISGTVCSDAGQNAIARLIEICGGILALYVSLPLLEAVLEMMRTMGGAG